MFPDKHFRDLESSRKRRKLLEQLGVSTAFIASFFFIGQLVHETFHLLMLELYTCSYTLDIGFQLMGGLHAAIQPFCSPTRGFLVLFYSAGYLSTLVTGVGLELAALRARGLVSNLLAATATGMLLSILLSAGQEGDIESLATVAGLGPGTGGTVSVLLVLLVLLASFLGVKLMLES